MLPRERRFNARDTGPDPRRRSSSISEERQELWQQLSEGLDPVRTGRDQGARRPPRRPLAVTSHGEGTAPLRRARGHRPPRARGRAPRARRVAPAVQAGERPARAYHRGMSLFGRAGDRAPLDRGRARSHPRDPHRGRGARPARRELTERVAAVEKRERELADVIARGQPRGSGSGPSRLRRRRRARPGRASPRTRTELNRRERDLTAREQARSCGWSPISRARAAAAETPRSVWPHRGAPRRASGGREGVRADPGRARGAERRPRAPRGGARRERASGVVDAGPVDPRARAELDELDERLRRLERETREATKEQGFGDGLRALEAPRAPRRLPILTPITTSSERMRRPLRPSRPLSVPGR